MNGIAAMALAVITLSGIAAWWPGCCGTGIITLQYSIYNPEKGEYAMFSIGGTGEWEDYDGETYKD